MNLISDTDRAAYKAAFRDLHETFGRTITVWRSSSQVITQTDDNYDAFNDSGTPNVVYTSESKDFIARIKYIDKQDKEAPFAFGNTNFNLDFTQEFQLVRIKVDKEANDYIKNCEKVTIDGVDYVPITVARPHGLLDLEYYTIYLKSYP